MNIFPKMFIVQCSTVTLLKVESHMLRRRWAGGLLWTAFVVLSAGAAIFTFRNFSTAFPLVSIELKGGGKQELGRILKEKIFALYTWRVRHFKQGDAHETLIRFTPDGTPYGFSVKLPEEERGDTRPEGEAQQIAETAAQRDWGIDFGRYRLVESSKDLKPGGRTDHTFVYER